MSVASGTLVGTATLVMVSRVTSAQISSPETAQHTIRSASQDGEEEKEQTAACTDTEVTEYVEKLGTSSLTEAEFQVVVNCGIQSVSALTKALKHSNNEVRSSAAYALGEIGSDAYAAVPALITALDDKFLDVSTLAAYALGKIGIRAESAVPVLGKIYNDLFEDLAVREMAAQSLRQIDTAQTREILSSPMKIASFNSLNKCQKSLQNRNISQSMICELTKSADQIKVAIQKRVRSNSPIICRLPGLSAILGRCR